MFVWLASYPKSGNTWLRAALWSLRADGGAVDLADLSAVGTRLWKRRTFERVLGVESSELTEDEIDTLRPLAIAALGAKLREKTPQKLHDAWRRTTAGDPILPASVTAGAIYVVRDPRAVAPSWAHHSAISIDRAITCLANPDASLAPIAADFGTPHLPERLLTWSQHVESWLDGPSQPPTVIRYEDMIEDPGRELTRAARVLEWPTDPATVENAVAATRFDVLRAAEDRSGFLEKAPGVTVFFRRGAADGWREELTAEQARRIERDHGRVMQRLGYL